jgi:hypothetical protein
MRDDVKRTYWFRQGHSAWNSLVTFRLPGEDHDALKAIAKARNLDVADLMRFAVKRLISEHPSPADATATPPDRLDIQPGLHREIGNGMAHTSPVGSHAPD